MNIQIFGRKKCFDTKKAERYFKERKIKGELARKRAVDYFSVEVMAQNYLHYYQGLVADVKSEK